MDETEVKFTVLGAGKDKEDKATEKRDSKPRIQTPIRPKIEYTILFPENNVLSQLVILKGEMNKEIVRIGPVIYKLEEVGKPLSIPQGRILQSEYKIDNSTIADIELPEIFIINNRLYKRIDAQKQPKIEYKYDKEGNLDHLRIDGNTYYPIERWEKEFEEIQAERERLEKEYEKKKKDLEEHYDIAYAEMADRLEMEKAKVAAEKDSYYAKEIIDMKKMFESAIQEQVKQKVAKEKRDLEERIKEIEQERKLLAQKEEELSRKEKVIESQIKEIKNTYDKMSELSSDNEYLLNIIKEYADIPGITGVKDIDSLKKLIDAFKISQQEPESLTSFAELERTPSSIEEFLSEQDKYFGDFNIYEQKTKQSLPNFFYVLVIEKLGYIKSSDIKTLMNITKDNKGKLEKMTRNEYAAFLLEKSLILDNPLVIKQLYDIKRNQMRDIKIGIYLMKQKNYANGLTNRFSHLGPGLGIYMTPIVYNGKEDEKIPSISNLLKEKSKDFGKAIVEKHSFPSGDIYEVRFDIF